MSVTTSQRFNQEIFDTLIPAGSTYGWVGVPFEDAGDKTITLTGGSDAQLIAAIATAAAAFVDHRAARAAAAAQLRQAYPTIRQWATDAATANTNWPTMTAAQKDATTRETIRRLGVLLDRFGDLLVLQGVDQ